MAPKLFRVCFSWCRQCSGQRRKLKKRRSRRLICSTHSSVAGRRGLVSRRAFLDEADDDDDDEDNEEDDEMDEEENDNVKRGGCGKRGGERGIGEGGGDGSGGRIRIRCSPKRCGYSMFDSPVLTLRHRGQWSPDSSLDRVDGERRGSLPLVTGLHDSMESVSTTSRLAQFFSKKGFRSNLKRTKSVTKLENRKQSTPSLSDGHDTSSLMGSLKRTMSLGRLARKKKSKRDKENQCQHQPQQQHQHSQHHPHLHQHQQRRASSTVSSKTNLINTPHSSPALSLISAQIRSAHSHESLLTSSHHSMHSINLSDPDVEVKPLHSSVLGQGHCFHVSTSQGSKYISCTTSEERDKWMYSLRRTIRPNEEHSRRSDSSLKLWVVEAKNLPVKKRYYCNILLDRTLYAQTSVKTMTDMLFWGEHFEFKSLPVVKIVTINLFREADKKKKKDKDMLVGYINLAVDDLENRQLIEKWITCNSGTVGKAGKETKSELPIIRIKARKQKVDILPLDTYQPFIKYLTTDYLSICAMLESVLVVREKEEFATSLVNILQTQGKACQFLCDIVMDEIDRLEDEHLTFRGNSIATKAMEAYMKLVGEKYLQNTLGEFISDLMAMPEDCEVDPTKVATPQLLQCQQTNLDMYCDMVWVKVINSFCYFPNEMREVFASLRSQCESRGKNDYSDNLISGCIFLRFLCPAILYPNLFHLTQEYPQEKASRNLTLIAKTIQTLANFTQFGTKEEFMTFMNKFVEREEENMKMFLQKISSEEAGNEFLQHDGDIDLGKELSVLHCMLLECRDKYEKTSGDKFEEINGFLNNLSSAFNDPTIGQRKPQRRSQIYDNMVHVPSPSKQPNSLKIDVETQQKSDKPPRVTKSSTSAMADKPTVPSSPNEILRDMLKICGESMDDFPADSTDFNNAGGMIRERSSSDMVLKSQSRTRSYSGDGGSKDRRKVDTGRQAVADVSVSSARNESSQDRINESWMQMVNAADSSNGDYIDLIPFMDEDVSNDSSVDAVDSNSTTGSQVQPLGFANPLFCHQQQEKHKNVPPHYSMPATQQQKAQQPLTRPPVVKAVLSSAGYAGPTPIAPQPTPRQWHAKTVQRQSSDSSTNSDEDSDDCGSTRHKKRGYKPPLRTTTAMSATTTTSDYQTSIAPLKKLSQLSSSSSDEDGSNGTPLSYRTNTTGPSFSSNPVNKQYSTSVNNSSPSSSSSSQSKTHNFNNPYTADSIALSSTAKNQPVSASSSSSYQTTFPASNVAAINGCSTFPRKHARSKFSYQDPNNDTTTNNNNNNNVSPPLPPREAMASSSSPAVPPKSASSRNAFLQRQFSQQTYSTTAGDQPSRPTFPPRNTNIVGITTNQAGQFQVRHTPSSSISQRQQQFLKHSISVDGSAKYATAPRPSVSRKPQKLQKPNQNSIETAIDSVEIGSYQGSPLHRQRLHNKPGFNNTNTNYKTNLSTGINNDSNCSNNENNNLPKMNGGNPTSVSTSTPSTSWQLTRNNMERSSSSQDTSTGSSSSESSPQSLLRSNYHHQQNTNSSSMQDSSSAHSLSSAPLSSSQPWGLITPSHSDSSNSLSSLSHCQQNPLRAVPVHSDSSSSLGGTVGLTNSSGIVLLPEHQSGSSTSINNNNNNNPSSSRTNINHIDNGLRQRPHQHPSSHRTFNHPPPPNSPNSNSNNTFASRLSSRSDGHINAITLQLQQQQHSSLTSSFSVANPIPHSPSTGSPTTPSRSLSYHSPTGSPNLSGGRSSYPASRSMDLSSLTKKPTTVEAMKRTSVDSLLSQVDSLSPTGSLSRDDMDGHSSSSSSNRRLSPQSAVHMGISSVQRKLMEQEKTKKEYETEVHGLRQQLLEAQERLQQAEMRLLDHEVDTHQLMDQWQSRLVESEEKMRKQQEEKDEKMKEIITRLQSIEDELKKEQEEMALAVEQKQQVIEVQEQRIETLDLANQKLLLALAELKGRALATQKQALNSGTKKDLTMEMAGLKTSSC